MGNFLAVFFALYDLYHVLQKKLLKKVSHFPTYGSNPYSAKGLEGGKLFQNH